MARALTVFSAVVAAALTAALPTLHENRFRGSLADPAAPSADFSSGSPLIAPAPPLLYVTNQLLSCDPEPGHPDDWKRVGCTQYLLDGPDASKAAHRYDDFISHDNARIMKDLGSTGKLGETLSGAVKPLSSADTWLYNPYILAAEAAPESHPDVSNGVGYECVDFDRWNVCMGARKGCAKAKSDASAACSDFRKKAAAALEADNVKAVWADQKAYETERDAACPLSTAPDCVAWHKCREGERAPSAPSCKPYRKALRAAYEVAGKAARSIVKAVYYDLLALEHATRDTVLGLTHGSDKDAFNRAQYATCGNDNSGCYEFFASHLDADNPKVLGGTALQVPGFHAFQTATRRMLLALRRTLGSKESPALGLFGLLFDRDAAKENDRDLRDSIEYLRAREAVELADASSLHSHLVGAVKAFRDNLTVVLGQYKALQADPKKAAPDSTPAKALKLTVEMLTLLDKAACNALGGGACNAEAGRTWARHAAAWLRAFALRRYDMEVEHPLITAQADCYGTGMAAPVQLRDGKSLPLAYPAVEPVRKCAKGAKPVMQQFADAWAAVEAGAKARADKAAKAYEDWDKARLQRWKDGKY